MVDLNTVPLTSSKVEHPSTGPQDGAASLWHVLDQARQVSTEDLLPSLAGLLVLRWAAFVEAEQEAISTFDDSTFTPSLPDSLRQREWTIHSSAVLAKSLAKAADSLNSITRDTPLGRYAAAVLPHVRECATQTPELFHTLVQWARDVSFDTPVDRTFIAQAFESFLAETVKTSAGSLGAFTTPQSVADLMVKLVDPKPGERVYDPCFGFGGLLVACAHRLQAATISTKSWSDIQQNGIYGVELNPKAYVVGLCRVVLAGIQRPGLELGDALERPLPRNRAMEGYDCILASPPWGGRIDSIKASHFPVATKNIESLFLQHVMGSLRPSGRAVIALPDGALFRAGQDGQIRKTLLTEFDVEAVLSLPAGAFTPHTAIKTSLLVFRRQAPRRSIHFLRVGLPGQRLPSDSGPTKPEEIIAAVRSPQRTVWSWTVPISDLSSRDYELVAKFTDTGLFDSSLERLFAIAPSLPAMPLEKIASIIPGLAYSRSHTIETPGPARVGRLLRVTDVGRDYVHAPSLFLNFTALNNKQLGTSKAVVEVGDVVLSVSGTIGKVGLVTEEPKEVVGSIAAKNLLVIRCQRGLSPKFLAALLRSREYQEWFASHARGTAIQHLSLTRVRKLPIVVPNLLIQEAVADDVRRTGGSALVSLERYLSHSAKNPITAWLERPYIQNLLSHPQSITGEPVHILTRLGGWLKELRAETKSEPTNQIVNSFEQWLEAGESIAKLLSALDGLSGSGRFATLELLRTRVESARQYLQKTNYPVATQLEQLSMTIVSLLNLAQQKLLENVQVNITLTPQEVVINLPTECKLHLTNESSLPIQDVRWETMPDFGSGQLSCLSEKTTNTAPLLLHVSSLAQSLEIKVLWFATRLDGIEIHGETLLSLLVRSTREAVLSGELGPSPYIVGKPVLQEEMFFGRNDVMQKIKLQLNAHDHANVILLEGNRRSGKTSILVQLKRREVLPGWIPVLCDLQGAGGDDTTYGLTSKAFYRLLTRCIAESIFDNTGIETWAPDQPRIKGARNFKEAFLKTLDSSSIGSNQFESFELYVAHALEAIQPKRLLLMIDEFDKLPESIKKGLVSADVPENLRHLLQHEARLSAIIAGSRELKRLTEQYWSAFFGLGYSIPIGSLDKESAQQLVIEPVKGRLTYLPQARDQVVQLCACRPFILQSFCTRIYERAVGSGERTITSAFVEASITAMLHQNKHFETLWTYAETDRRRFLIALCGRFAEGPDPVNLDFLEAKLVEYGILSREKDLVDDLVELQELEMLEFDPSHRGGTYRVTVPLIARWVAVKDFNTLVALARHEAMEAR